MKRFMIIILSALFMMPQPAEAQDNENSVLTVMSYNIRHAEAKDGTNSWPFRYLATKDMLEDQAPDVFGVQEALPSQLIYIKEYCSYDYVGVGRDDGKKKGEYMAIFWNKKNISMLKWDTFWLSETPGKPSMGWDAACFRTATWALMKDKRTGKKFYFVNTHLDHIGTEAQEKGLQLILEEIAKINKDNLPMVLTGDFNITPDNNALVGLDSKMESARKVAAKTDNLCTYNGW